MDIQWYPGHMAKARRIMEENLKLIDIVIELLDARIPYSSKNPEIDKLACNKKRIVILNKNDMADSTANVKWAELFKSTGNSVIMVNSINGAGLDEVYKEAQRLMEDKSQRAMKRGRTSITVRAMVTGIPNVGKSTFINKLVGKRSANVGNKPGVTKGPQWLKIKNGFELLDTPGILWPKFEDKDVAIRLALTGAIKDELLDKGELCRELILILGNMYPNAIYDRYGVEINGKNPFEAIEEIAIKRGHIRSKGILDINRTFDMIIDEYRKLKLGNITLELPDCQSSNNNEQ